jgi:hypothetical protein
VAAALLLMLQQFDVGHFLHGSKQPLVSQQSKCQNHVVSTNCPLAIL